MLELPGQQDDLIRNVAAVNPRTTEVVNAGSPVAMPWIDDVQITGARATDPFTGEVDVANGSDRDGIAVWD